MEVSDDSCDGCIFYGRHPDFPAQGFCAKYQNIYCKKCDKYQRYGEEPKVEVPVDTKREFIDFSGLGSESKEDKIKRLEAELNSLKEDNA